MSIDFKDNETLIPVNQSQNQYQDSNSESAFIGSWSSSSSSSFLTPSFGSELDSYEADLDDSGGGDGDDEFIAELTRRMTDYMLDENDDDGVLIENQSSKQFQEPSRRSYADTVKKSIAGVQPEQSVTKNEQSQPPIQMYKVENQPRVRKGGKMSESTQQVYSNRRGYSYSNNYRGGGNGGGKGLFHHQGVGSAMRAIFLGSGSRNVRSGTGVFLPRSSTDATDQRRKKSGCSTVLVPTRVLQALEQHFNNIESLSQSNNVATQTHHVNKEKMQTEESVSVDHQDSKLPQDWIY